VSPKRGAMSIQQPLFTSSHNYFKHLNNFRTKLHQQLMIEQQL
jgi:hypothetical protein